MMLISAGWVAALVRALHPGLQVVVARRDGDAGVAAAVEGGGTQSSVAMMEPDRKLFSRCCCSVVQLFS